MNDTATIQAAIAELEAEQRALRDRLRALRQQLPRRPFEDVTFLEGDGRPLKLSELFAGHDRLLVVHNMGAHCRYCTLWADGFNGFVPHLEGRLGFAVESPDDPETMRKFSSQREWTFQTVSSEGTPFRRDAGFVDEAGDPSPGLSVFLREPDGTIVQGATVRFGPGDDYCSIWNLFDLLPEGIDDWEPKFRY